MTPLAHLGSLDALKDDEPVDGATQNTSNACSDFLLRFSSRGGV